MPRPRRQLDAKASAEQVWFKPAQLARRLGCSQTEVRRRECARPLYKPQRGPDGILYHIDQVRLIDAVIAGNRTEDEAQKIWALKRGTIGIAD